MLRPLLLLLALMACGKGPARDILSPEERHWLGVHQERLVLAVESAYAPFVFLDDKGQPAGLAHDHLRLLETKLGVRFRQRQFSNLDDILTKARSGEIQVVNAVTETPARSEFLSFTRPFITVPNVIVVRKEHSGTLQKSELRGIRVSLVRSYAVTEHLLKKVPVTAPDLVPDDLTGLLNVSFDRSDAMVLDLATASYLIQKNGITNLRVAGEVGFDIHLSMAAPKAETQLLSILQKGLGAMSEAERREIRTRWINASGPSLFTSWRFWAVAGGLLTLVLLSIGGMVVWNRALTHQVALRTQALVEEKAALQESEARNRALVSAIPDLLFTNRRDGEFLDVQASDPRLLFAPPERFLHRKITDILPAPLAARFMAALAEAMDSKAVQELTYALPLAEGERHFEARLVPCTETTVITLVRDITERKQAELALRESEKRLSDILNSVNAYVFIKDTAYRYTYVNPRVCELFGHPPEDILGKEDGAFFAPASVAEIRESDRPVIEQGQTIAREEKDLQAADGKPRTFWAVKIPLRDDHDRIYGLCGISTDITLLKEAEEERRQLQCQLQQTQKMESLGSLAGGVAHDMNNVLGAILGLATAHLATQPADGPVHQAFDTIAKAATRGGQMVKSLLSFARQSPAEDEELDLNGILQEEVRLLEHTTLSRVRLAIDLAPELRPMRGDASALTHAIMNLCVNAVDAMPDAGTLTLRTRNGEGGWIELTVEDTGSGMTKEVLEKALDPFFTTKAHGKGTGLGLSMVYSTVKAHQGQLELQSSPGQGTSVKLRFPTCKPAEPLRAASPERLPGSTSRYLCVLLVDDDELIQSSVQMMLEAMGHTVLSALSGEAALAQLEEGAAPDVVILDMNMPGWGGLGTLPRLRAFRPALPVLLATGRTDQSALDLLQRHPSVCLLSKPFGLDDLQQNLASLFPA